MRWLWIYTWNFWPPVRPNWRLHIPYTYEHACSHTHTHTRSRTHQPAAENGHRKVAMMSKRSNLKYTFSKNNSVQCVLMDCRWGAVRINVEIRWSPWLIWWRIKPKDVELQLLKHSYKDYLTILALYFDGLALVIHFTSKRLIMHGLISATSSDRLVH